MFCNAPTDFQFTRMLNAGPVNAAGEATGASDVAANTFAFRRISPPGGFRRRSARPARRPRSACNLRQTIPPLTRLIHRRHPSRVRRLKPPLPSKVLASIYTPPFLG